jgi:hypothetical protein
MMATSQSELEASSKVFKGINRASNASIPESIIEVTEIPTESARVEEKAVPKFVLSQTRKSL